jgi:hypothetical protein
MEEKDFDVQGAIKELIEYVGHLANEITEIKTTMMDELINPIHEEYDKMQYENALSDFRCKYAEKLEPMSDKLKAIEADDGFDVVKKAFDGFMNRTDGMEQDTYVEKFAEKVQSQIDAIGKAFGVEPEKIEEVKIETEDGEVKAEVEDGEVTNVEGEAVEETPPATEEPTEEKVKEVVEEEKEPAEVPVEEVKEEEKEEPEEKPKKPSISERIHSITH